MTRLLRTQANQIDAANNSYVDQESAFERQLIELYGTPYAGDMGAGKTYQQDFTGPDTENWFIIDRPSNLVDPTAPYEISLRVGTNLKSYPAPNSDAARAAAAAGKSIRPTVQDIADAYNDDKQTTLKSFWVQPNDSVAYSDTVFGANSNLGQRRVVGTLQQALLDAHEAWVKLYSSTGDLADNVEQFKRRHALYQQMVETQLATAKLTKDNNEKILSLQKEQTNLAIAADFIGLTATTIRTLAQAVKEYLPTVVGLSSDATSGARGGILFGAVYAAQIFDIEATGLRAKAQRLELTMAEKQNATEYAISQLGFSFEQAQAAYEYEFMLRPLVAMNTLLDNLATDLQRKRERVRSLVAEGERLKKQRESFRQRAAAVIQGYRTRDLSFRAFRTEALDQYRILFDLASRYTYLSAKSYDYETGLLGSTQGQQTINKIVAARSLGDLTNGVPQATADSSLGDAGLAGTMARLQADWSVAKGRLGINNPDQNGTLFSLRRELFRKADDPTRTDDDTEWQQELQNSWRPDLRTDPRVANLARGIEKTGGGAVPGFLIEFSTKIGPGENFFDKGTLLEGEHTFSSSNYATKIYSVGMVFRGYEGMDPYQTGTVAANVNFGANPKALSATPYAYLIPVGEDKMRAPPLGDTGLTRSWMVSDQALPLPYNLGATAFSSTQFYSADGTMSEAPWVVRKHQAFRPVADPTFFYGSIPAEFTSSRLVGRSVWNSKWILVIPAYTLHGNEQTGYDRFVASVKDIEIFLRTYSHAGN